MTDDEAAQLAKAAERFTASARPKAGPLRAYLREHEAAVMKIKEERGLSWKQMAVLLSERGLTKANGDPLDANTMAVTAAHVRWEKSERRQRRGKSKTLATAPPLPLVSPSVPAATENEVEEAPDTSARFRPAAHKGTRK